MCRVLTIMVPLYFSTLVTKTNLPSLQIHFYVCQYNIYALHKPTYVMPSNSLITISSQFQTY